MNSEQIGQMAKEAGVEGYVARGEGHDDAAEKFAALIVAHALREKDVEIEQLQRLLLAARADTTNALVQEPNDAGELRKLLVCIRDNLRTGMSRSIQKLQAESINEVLGLEKYAFTDPQLMNKSDCTVNRFSSAVCVKGTKSCTSKHLSVEALQKELDEAREEVRIATNMRLKAEELLAEAIKQCTDIVASQVEQATQKPVAVKNYTGSQYFWMKFGEPAATVENLYTDLLADMKHIAECWNGDTGKEEMWSALHAIEDVAKAAIARDPTTQLKESKDGI
jgi:hypothetical protein